MTSDESPNFQGCRWPAEWEPHAATWIAWPHNQNTWPGRFHHIPERFATMIATLAQHEMVHVLAGGEEVRTEAHARVGRLANVTLHDIPTNDAWIRDYGPTFLLGPQEHEISLIDWQFNSWGQKYPPWDLDNAVPGQIACQQGRRKFAAPFVLEGGSIDGNGQGTILTTSTCLLDPRRNPHTTRQEMEQALHQYCGAEHVIWIPGGPIAGDDTDGHVDQLARFVGSHRIVVSLEDDPSDENYEALQVNFRTIKNSQDNTTEPVEIIPLPMPKPIFFDQQRVPASYCNFYIANDCVLLPAFDDPADAIAAKILGSLFPDREVISLPARDLVWGLGAFHCLTQQEPATSERRRG